MLLALPSPVTLMNSMWEMSHRYAVLASVGTLQMSQRRDATHLHVGASSGSR